MDSASDLNKRKVRLFVEAVWNEGRLELIDELVAADYLGRVPSLETGVRGPDGVRRLVADGRRAHPNLYVKVVDQVAEDDRVATRWRATTAAGRSPCYAGISIVRLLAGKQVDSETAFSDLTAASERSAVTEPGHQLPTFD